MFETNFGFQVNITVWGRFKIKFLIIFSYVLTKIYFGGRSGTSL